MRDLSCFIVSTEYTLIYEALNKEIQYLFVSKFFQQQNKRSLKDCISSHCFKKEKLEQHRNRIEHWTHLLKAVTLKENI